MLYAVCLLMWSGLLCCPAGRVSEGSHLRNRLGGGETEKARAAEPERPELSFPREVLREEEPGFVQRVGHFPMAVTPFPGKNGISVSP